MHANKVDYTRNRNARNKVNEIMTRYGTTSAFIADSIGLNRSTFSQWRIGNKNLSNRNMNDIEMVITKIGGGK